MNKVKFEITKISNDVVATSSSVLPGFTLYSGLCVGNECSFYIESYGVSIRNDALVTILNEKGEMLIDNKSAKPSFVNGSYYHYNSTTGEFILCDNPNHHSD